MGEQQDKEGCKYVRGIQVRDAKQQAHVLS